MNGERVIVHQPSRLRPWSRPRWQVDVPALSHAHRIIGLDSPVELFVGLWLDEHGYYYLGRVHERDTHMIVVGWNQSRADASRTIWHELWHAWQVEALFHGNYDAFRATGDAASLERAAQHAEARHNEQPLTERRHLWRR